MKRIVLASVFCLAACVAVCYAAAAKSVPPVYAPPGSQTYLSPTAIVTDGATLYIACATSAKIVVVDVKTGKLQPEIKIDAPANGITLANKTLYVTQGLAPGKLTAIDLKTRKQTDLKTGLHSPCAPVVVGKSVYVADRFRNVVINATTGKTIPVSREPIALAATPDGKALVVANLLPADKADGNTTYARVSLIDTATDKCVKTIPLSNGATGVRGVAISPDGKFAYITHILARYQLPTTMVERGGIATNAIAIIDLSARKLFTTVLLDDVDQGAANPWAVAVSDDGKTLVATHAGTHEVSIIDRAAMHKRIAGHTKKNYADEIPNRLSFLTGIRRRINLFSGNTPSDLGPRSIVLTGRIAWVPMYFSDTLVRVSLDDTTPRAATSLPLGPKPKLTQARQGEIFYHDAKLCLQGWLSCTSCHPDARTDALNWDLLHDGLGNPKQAKSMLFSHVTAPVMITGNRPTASYAVRSGIRFIQYAIRPDSDAQAIDAWLKSLKPVASPYLVKTKLSASATRGKTVFKTAECARCHSGQYFTDCKLYDVGLGIDLEAKRKFDTPTLREIWRTAPYLYDGRAKTMMDVLTTHNKNDTHGKTSKLTKAQLTDLANYVLSL